MWRDGWKLEVSGFWMYKVIKHFKVLKKPLRKLLYDHGNIHDNVKKLRKELDEAQIELDSDPNNIEKREIEATVLKAFNDAIMIEESFLNQKAKVDWLKLGDANTSYFHNVVKSQAARNRIDCLTNSDGTCLDGDQVSMAFIEHYTNFLGQDGSTSFFVTDDLFSNRLSNKAVDHMVREVTSKEIRDAIFAMGDNKAPGPDGYSALFFKESWNIIASDVTKAVKEFFTNGFLLKELNHTIIALIPKVNTPMSINDYRPISCCNVLLKCISSIIANRMKDCLQKLVCLNQYAFVSGRRISDNILLIQELMHNYHLDRGVPSINGCLHGYFKGKRGLRQGDPISPYLFTLIMEVLTLMLHRRVWISNTFTYHRYYANLNIINLRFADDLFLFTHGDVDSARVIIESLDEFKGASGLTPSIPKSKAYFCNVLNYVKLGILIILLFEEGWHSVKYLGVPLVPSRLIYRDCAKLMEKMKRRIYDWKNKFLSFAGRTQFVRSVLSSMHIYWASVFVLPSSLMFELEQIMRGFLWCQGDMKKGNAKIMHTCIFFKDDKKELFCSFVYAHNRYMQRRELWDNLVMHKAYVQDRPWCVLGGLNVSLTANEKSIGSLYVDREIRGFQECVDCVEFTDVKSMEFYEVFIGSCAHFQPYRISDHSPVVLRIPMSSSKKPRPFKFYNILTQNPRFNDVVSDGWKLEVSGFWMYKVIKRLKVLKKPLRLDFDPNNIEKREMEATVLKAFNNSIMIEESFLNQKAKDGGTSLFVTDDLFSNRLSNEAADHMVHEESWNIIASDVTKAVKEFFTNGFLLKELNHTIIALIPKVNSPMSINDYRPISCCNVLLKCIKLMHNYHLDRGVPRCAFKVDIQNAYDTVDWNFLRNVLGAFGFHTRIIVWIMECVTSTSFSISINGCLHGYFKGKRGLRQGWLSVKYLGVPLVPSRLIYRDCAELMEKMKKRICDWKNKFLSFTGRTQLVRSVLSSMHIYWASIFILPSSLMFELEQIIRGFLWCQGDMKKGKAKVTWEAVCLPKKKGGLGIRRLESFNKALISSHIWSIITNKESLWVWHNIRPFIWTRIRNGLSTSAWFDLWCSLGNLSNIISNRDIYSAGFRLDAKVADLIQQDEWVWLGTWYVKYPLLANVQVSNISDAMDDRYIRNLNNKEVKFSVAEMWECIGHKNTEVSWFHVVWFPSHIPHHAIHLCLDAIVDFLIPLANLKSLNQVVCKLGFAATCYFIWQERNIRLFKKTTRTQEQIINVIKSNVRIKLLSCSFKKCSIDQLLIQLWKIPNSVLKV
nr:hypothetical protein [Tanacetum cinerariifolium]